MKLNSISSLFGASWAFYKRRFFTLVGITAFPYIFSVVAAFIYTAFLSGLVGYGYLFYAILGIYILIFLSLAFASGLALIYSMKDGLGIVPAYKKALGGIKSFSWIFTLVFLTTLGGFMMGFVPGIIIGTWLALAVFVFVCEGDKGFSALLKSREYVRNLWWDVFARILVASLLITLALFVFAFALFIVGMIATILLNNSLIMPALSLIPRLAGLLLGPFFSVILFNTYIDITLAKPELVGKKIEGSRRFWIFLAILGPLMPVIIIGMLYYLLPHIYWGPTLGWPRLY